MSRFLLILSFVAVVVSVAVSSSTAFSMFTESSDNPQVLTADRVSRWLSIYSQSTDPDNLENYAIRRGSNPPTPAAIGVNESLEVNLGGFSNSNSTNVARVFTLKAPSSFPDSEVTSITVQATTTPDSKTGLNPITSAQITNLNGNGAASSKVLSPSSRFQLRLTVRTRGEILQHIQYTPHIQLTVTFNGFNSTFFRYSIPVKIYSGSGAGPD